MEPTMPESTALAAVIAVLTYKRPDDIKLALETLSIQAESVPYRIGILVIDNDPEGGAETTVRPFVGDRVRYVHEPKPGIAAGRNRALMESADWPVLIFVDDDEVPTERWLEHLLDTYSNTHAAAVVGPVVSEYAHDLDPWMLGGRFFDRRRMATGTPVQAAATNNLLLDLDQLKSMGVVFDERYGLSGGSDTLFTRQIVGNGGAMVWCDEAIVIDRVPAERLTREWVLQRAFRSGNSWSRTGLELSHGGGRVAVRVRSVAAGIGRMGAGGLQFVLGWTTRNVAHKARGARTVMRGAGLASGAFGHVYSEYKREPVRSE
jgi:glycosyltransferase involved in cell wall biosynthesis